MKTIKSLTRLALFAFGLSALAVGSAFAASNVAGAITGEVTTVDGEPVQGASVTVSSEATGFSRTLTTNADGEFRFAALKIGDYTLTVNASGYQNVDRPVSVSVGTTTNAYVTLLGANQSAQELGTVTVTGAVISPIDISSTTSALNISKAQIDRIPVGRGTTSIALLAPTTTSGDTSFGFLPSIGGSSVAENVVYINGLNVTNFRNGLGFSSLPFEMIQEYQVKLSGVSAKFGRTTGGVINIVTKSGSNEFHWGASMYIQPWIDSINGADPDVYTYVDTVAVDPNFGAGDVDTDANPVNDGSDDYIQAFPGGTLVSDNQHDENTSTNINLWASGPIIEDTLFYYVIVESNNAEAISYAAPSGRYFETSTDTPFYGTKLDWYVTDQHLLSLTLFSDDRDVVSETFDYTPNPAGNDEIGTVGNRLGSSTSTRGGLNYALKYTGYFTPNFTLSAMVGENEFSRGTFPADPTATLVIDEATGAAVFGAEGGRIDDSLDTRTQYRIDAEWALGDHLLSFGYDYEELEAKQNTYNSGTAGLVPPEFFNVPPDAVARPVYFLDQAGNIRVEVYAVSGSFITENSAFYVEDEWQVTDNFFLRLGLRNDIFKSKTPNGTTFVELTDQLAPRLGASWDVHGDGSLKVFGSFSRYYLPIALNTNIRGVGGEFFEICTYQATGPYTGGIPTLGNLISCSISSNGEPADPDFFTAVNLEPMYMDEFTVGFKQDLGDGWVFGLTGMHRELGETIEDLSLGYDVFSLFTGFPYRLANPGSTVIACQDLNGDGVCAADGSEYVSYPPLVPKPTRIYNALVFELEKVWNGEYFLNATYTWAHSYGNYEGWVRSDNGQSDAGITNLFDIPGTAEGAYGDLPNDRRHSLKIRAAWQFAEHWLVGTTFLMESGRPVNVFGNYPPTNAFTNFHLENAYRLAFFRQEGELVPRASRYPRTPMTTNINMNIQYTTEVGEGDLTLALDVFNVFNAHNTTEVVETNEVDVGLDLSGLNGTIFPPGTFPVIYQNYPVDSTFHLPTAFQSPRSIRLSASITF